MKDQYEFNNFTLGQSQFTRRLEIINPKSPYIPDEKKNLQYETKFGGVYIWYYDKIPLRVGMSIDNVHRRALHHMNPKPKHCATGRVIASELLQREKLILVLYECPNIEFNYAIYSLEKFFEEKLKPEMPEGKKVTEARAEEVLKRIGC